MGYAENMRAWQDFAPGQHFPVDEKARADRVAVKEAARKAGIFNHCRECGQVVPE